MRMINLILLAINALGSMSSSLGNASRCSEEIASNGIYTVQSTSHEFVGSNLDSIYCGLEYIQYSSIASNLLCHYYLEQHDLVAAYRYALRSLEIVPDRLEAIACLAAVNFNRLSFMRAAFYSEHVYHLAVKVPVESAGDHLFIHLRDTMPQAVYPKVSTEARRHLQSSDSTLMKVANTLDGSVSVWMAYMTLQKDLPSMLRGSSVLSKEEFLEYVEALLSPEEHSGWFSSSDVSSYDILESPFLREDILVVEDSDMCVQWPVDKSINICSLHQLYSTFGETNIGLSDALNKLGVSNRIPSTPISDTNNVLVRSTGGERLGDSPEKFIIWNFEKAATAAVCGSPTGFIKDSCGREESAYANGYVNESMLYWESIPSNMIKWDRAPEAVTHKSLLPQAPIYVPGFVPDNVLRMTRANMLFGGEYDLKLLPRTLSYKYICRFVHIRSERRSTAHRHLVLWRVQRPQEKAKRRIRESGRVAQFAS